MTRNQTRYREGLDLVLKGVSFSIGPGEKVRQISIIHSITRSLILFRYKLITN